MNCKNLSLLLISFSLASSAHAQDPFSLMPGVVVHPGSGRLFLQRPDGLLASYDADGRLLWASNEPARPIGVVGETLVAQTERGDGNLELLRLNLADGMAQPARIVHALSQSAVAHLDDRLHSRFSTEMRTIEGEPFLRWQYTFRRVQGMPTGDDQPVVTAQAGKLDFAQNLFQAQGAQFPTDPARALPGEMSQWLADHHAGIAPTRVGTVWACSEWRNGSAGPEIVLKRWNGEGGEALPDVLLHQGPFVLMYASADGRHLLVTTQATSGSLEYLWTLFSLESGEVVGTNASAESQGHFTLVGNRLIHTGQPGSYKMGAGYQTLPLRLMARELGNPAPLWELPLRDTRYFGPFPP